MYNIPFPPLCMELEQLSCTYVQLLQLHAWLSDRDFGGCSAAHMSRLAKATRLWCRHQGQQRPLVQCSSTQRIASDHQRAVACTCVCCNMLVSIVCPDHEGHVVSMQISRLVSLQSYLAGDEDEPKALLHSSGADLSVSQQVTSLQPNLPGL